MDRADVGLIPGFHETGGEDEEKALEKAILFLATDFLEQQRLETADDADNRMGNVAREIVVRGHDRLGGPEGEVVLTILAAAAVHGADEAVEFVSNDDEAGGIGQPGGEGVDGGSGGEEAIEARSGGGAVGRGGPAIGGVAPGFPGFCLKGIEGEAGGAEGGSLAEAGGTDEGDPEGGALGPAWSDGKSELATDEAASEGEEGEGDEGGGDTGFDGGGFKPGGDGGRKGCQGEGDVREEGRRWARPVTKIAGDGLVEVRGGLGARVGHGWLSVGWVAGGGSRGVG